MIEAGEVIVFQGDSITDAGRGKDVQAPNDPHGLGVGYAAQISARLLAERPADDLKCYNRGISGHRVPDLYARWKIHALNLEPTLISILIGINDTWHGKNADNGVEVPRYEMIYREMLKWTRDVLPNVKLVLCEPFITRCGTVTDDWIPEVQERQAVVAKLADEFDGRLVKFQSMFDAACEEAPPEYWANDGVHPTPAGFHRMAEFWYQSVVG